MTNDRWTVRFREGGEGPRVDLRPGPRAEMDDCLAALLPEDPEAEIVDLHAELDDEFPDGTRVLAGVSETSPGAPGVVATQAAGCAPLTHGRYDPDELVSVAIGHQGDGYVCVRLDGLTYLNWFAIRYVKKETPVPNADQ